MNPSACPSARELEDLLEDRLPPDLVRVVDQHLRECPDCLGRLDRLSRERERTDLPGLSRVESRPNDRTPNPDVPADETEVELPEGITIGTCEILREIGRGGMGVVYEARNRGSGVRVAVKVLAAPALVRKNAAARFATEARAMARLRHPGIVRVYDAGVWSSGRGMPPVPYTVLELINGPSLRTLLTDGPLPFTTAASIVEQIARAVHHAHENGVIHRDLKPANILMVKEEDVAPEDRDSEDSEEDRKASIGSSTYRPKVTDFGIAKLRDETSGLTGSRDLLGTPEYMPPELGEPGRQASVSMDVYALGVILFECLTGRVPFRGASPVQTLLIAQSREAEPPSRTQPDIPRALDAIVLKCLAKKPTRRYPSAARLADDLAAFRRGEIDPSPTVLRRRAAVGVLAVAALTGSLALVLATRGALSRLNSQSDAPPVAARVNAKGLVPSNHPRSTQTLEFREGVDGFEACEVLELRPSMGAAGTDVHNPSLSIVSVTPSSAHPPGFEQQALLRFDHVFGTAPNQVPPGSRVKSGTLRLWVKEPGRELSFRRLLAPWSARNTTWENFRKFSNREPGVQADGIEAAVEFISVESSRDMPTAVDVTADLQKWAKGEANLGWAISTSGTATVQWPGPGCENIAERPLLTIEFTAPQPGQVTAVDNIYSTRREKPLSISATKGVLCNDWADGSLSASLVSRPLHGNLELREDGSFHYTPDRGFVGRDSFRYRASNSNSHSDAAVWIFVDR